MSDRQAQLVHRLVEEQARRRPEALAASARGRRLPYRELNERANRLAHTLISRGVGPEARVCLLMDRSIEMLTGFLAVLKAGGTAVLLDPAHPATRLEQAVVLSAAEVLLTLDRVEVAATVDAGDAFVMRLDRDGHEIASASATDPDVAVHPDNLAYVVHTSGSTGAPKPVGVTHRSVAHSVVTHQRGHGICPEDRASWLSPPGSSVSVGELWPYLAAGASVHAATPQTVQSPPDLRDWLVKERVTKTYLSMPLAEQLYTLDWPEECALRLMTVGSDQVRRWAPPTLAFEVAVAYGSSEANGISSCLVPWEDRLTSVTASDSDRQTLPPVGRTWPGITAHVLDPDGWPVPDGTTGELWVAGPELARGYLGDPAQTADRFRPDPYGSPGERMYRTGDLVRRRPDGMLEHHGRVDREIKIRGFRVHPAEVEAELLRHPDIRDAAVTAVDDEQRGRVLAAYLVASPGLAVDQLPELLADRLPPALVPGAFTLLDHLPTGPNGKVDLPALPSPDWRATSRAYRPPTNDVEQCLTELFAEVLQHHQVGAEDNFFHLGGDSLSGSRLTVRLRERFDQQVPLRMVFRHPTAKALASHLQESGINLVGNRT